MRRIVILIINLLLLQQTLYSRTLSPLDYGLSDAKTGIERYYVLLRTHEAAIERKAEVSYKGIGKLDIEIPSSFNGIPLSEYTDFAGVEINVKNQSKEGYLFLLSQQANEINISKEVFLRGDLKRIPELRRGLKLLIIEDKTPWVKQRSGYNYGATRRDIILLKNGRIKNRPVCSYSTSESSPKFLYTNISKKKKIIKNVTFNRTKDSKYKTFFVRVQNQNNVLLQNITVNTPESELYGDKIFVVYNATNVEFSDVNINGTYSQRSNFGYGIALDNVWNSRFVRLKTHSKWGIFGNNNVNYSVLKDCDINRFDVHCYGRDVYCYNTTFRNQYNQFSSFFGELVFENCNFLNFLPVLFESSYFAYTPFDIKIKNCEIELNKDAPYLIRAGNLASQPERKRAEIDGIAWPNVSMEKVTITLPTGVKELVLFNVSGKAEEEVEYMSRINMYNVSVRSNETKPRIHLSNVKVRTKSKLDVGISKCSFNNIEL